MLWSGCSFLRCLEMERCFWKPCWTVTEDLDWDSPTLIKIWHSKVLAKGYLSSQTHCPGQYWKLLLLRLLLSLPAVATAIVSKGHIRTADLEDLTSSENWGNVFLHFSKKNRNALRSMKNLQNWLSNVRFVVEREYKQCWLGKNRTGDHNLNIKSYLMCCTWCFIYPFS